MTKYIINWTKANGEQVKNQLFTREHIENKLKELEDAGATDIYIKSVKVED